MRMGRLSKEDKNSNEELEDVLYETPDCQNELSSATSDNFDEVELVGTLDCIDDEKVPDNVKVRQKVTLTNLNSAQTTLYRSRLAAVQKFRSNIGATNLKKD